MDYLYQHGINTFLDLITGLNYDMTTEDEMNYYVQDPPPDETFYVHVYDQHI